MGVDNGDAAANDKLYKDTKRTVFNGKCLVIVQSTGEPNTIAITASSPGLTAASVSVSAQQLTDFQN